MKHRVSVAVCLVVSGTIGSYLIGRAQAAGIPTDALYYSGYLEDTGAPVNGSRNIGINIYTASAGGSPVCAVPAAATNVQNGWFRVPFGTLCINEVRANQTLYVEVNVGGAALLPRSKVGAAPYAIEADSVQWAGVKSKPTAWPGTIPWSGVNPGPTATDTWPGKVVFAGPSSSASVNAGYCGSTSSPYTASQVGGYAGAKAKCQAACGKTTAHICSGDEMVRSVGAGSTVTGSDGWISSPISPRNDCAGFTWTGSSDVGTAWSTTAKYATAANCTDSRPVLCCD